MSDNREEFFYELFEALEQVRQYMYDYVYEYPLYYFEFAARILARYYVEQFRGTPRFSIPNIPVRIPNPTTHIPSIKHYYRFIPYRKIDRLPVMFILR